jgi:Uma2 family endonuclease
MRPEGGFTAADLDNLRGLPPHTELIDGGLVFVSPRRRFQMKVISLLEARLSQAALAGLVVVREMSVQLSDRQRVEPDISILTTEDGGGDTWYPAESVLLVVEVVSPDSQERDRERKPQLYARAGIKHFWRVEENANKPVVYVYELDPATSVYARSGIHHDRLKLTVPFDMDIDLNRAIGPSGVSLTTATHGRLLTAGRCVIPGAEPGAIGSDRVHCQTSGSVSQ